MDRVLAGDFWPLSPRGVSAHRRTCYPTNQSACTYAGYLRMSLVDVRGTLSLEKLKPHPHRPRRAFCILSSSFFVRSPPPPGCQRAATWLREDSDLADARARPLQDRQDQRRQPGCPRRVRACQGVRCARGHNGFSFERNWRKPLELSFAISVFNQDIATLD